LPKTGGGLHRIKKMGGFIVYGFKFLKNHKNTIKTRANFKRSDEIVFSNLNCLIPLNLNFIEYVEMGPNGPLGVSYLLFHLPTTQRLH
jgi:hypothetical protein